MGLNNFISFSKQLGLTFLGLGFCCLWTFQVEAQEFSVKDSIQSELEMMFDELDAVFAEDSLDLLFAAADSIFAAERIKISSLHPRIGYVSQVTTAGRDLAIEQYGFSPGLTYYHHTGLFADVSGFVNSEYDPSYYLTTTSIGYMHVWNDLLTSTLSHDFYFYNDTLSSHTFDKSAAMSSFLDYKFINLGVDYSFLYGNEQSHRINTYLGIDKRWTNISWLKSLSIHPNVSVQWGNADVVFLRQTDSPARDLFQIMVGGDYPDLTNDEYRRLARMLRNDRTTAAIAFLVRRGYSEEDILEIQASFYEVQSNEENVFGLMNYAFSLPIIINFTDQLTLLSSYTYNIPIALPGESFEYENNGFFTLSLSYKLIFVK